MPPGRDDRRHTSCLPPPLCRSLYTSPSLGLPSTDTVLVHLRHPYRSSPVQICGHFHRFPKHGLSVQPVPSQFLPRVSKPDSQSSYLFGKRRFLPTPYSPRHKTLRQTLQALGISSPQTTRHLHIPTASRPSGPVCPLFSLVFRRTLVVVKKKEKNFIKGREK